MSLKAYDGLICRKSLFHIQNEIKSILPKLKEASENKLAKVYADMIVNYVDFGINPIKHLKFDLNNQKKLMLEIEKIKLKDVSLLSVVFQVGNIMSESHFVNDCTVHLNITIEAVNNRKTLLYPNILVYEHRDILLEVFDDWHAQNNSDKPEGISTKQWKQRNDDWWNFDATKGMTTQINLFSPKLNYGMNSVNKNFRGDELIEKIINHIPTQKKRIRKLAIDKLTDKELEDNPIDTEQAKKERRYSYFMNINRKWKGKEKSKEVNKYIKDNNLTVTKIDKDYLNKKRDFSK